MNKLSDIDPNKRISLSKAWDYLADFVTPGFDYRADLDTLAKAGGDETLEERDDRKAQYEKLENSLKRQFLYSIEDKAVQAFGYDLSRPGGASERTQIAAELFNPDDRQIEVFWEDSRLEVGDLVVRGIEVQPDIERLMQLWPGDADDYGQFVHEDQTPKEPIPLEPADAKKGGRPNTQQRVKEFVTGLFDTDPEFAAIPDRRTQAREVRERMLGKEYRLADEHPGWKTETIRRWIGEIAPKK